MAKFRFRLSPLLKIREHVREERQGEFIKAQEAERIILEQLDRVRAEITNCLEMGRSAIQSGRISVDYLLALRRQEAFLLTQQNHADGQLKLVREEIERRRLALMEADRDVKVLEKLREKMEERHQQEEQQVELKQIDEIAGIMRSRG
ncbi:MAG: flagellar export protein FliJ [Thermoguttaceae bacterium]